MMCVTVTACKSMALTYEGTPARPDNRFPLAASEGEPAEWKAKDMALYYEMAPEDGVLDIHGTVKRLGTIGKYPVISYFRVSIHFIDADGIIVGSHQLWSAGNQVDQRYVRWTFEKRFPQPPGATAIGFSYQGGFNENGGKVAGKVGWEVRRRP
jgi:hypothetical protein